MARYYISSGVTSNGIILDEDASMVVLPGGVANTTTVNSGGSMCLSSGGVANDTTVNFGGTMRFFGGTANSTTVNSGGSMYLSSGGVANDISVGSGGRVFVSSGAKLTGQMMFSDGAIVRCSSSILDFNISELAPGGTPLVNDLSFVKYSGAYTLTVSGTQENGTYRLAGGAKEFNKTISVVNTLGDELGTLVIGDGRTNIGGIIYTLDRNGSDLTVTVEDRSMIPDVTKSDIDANGVSDVMFHYTGGQGQTGFWMNGTNEWRSTNTFHSTDTWKAIGAYDMDADGKADSVFIGNTEVDGVKGTFVGYYTDANDTDENWVNISFLADSEKYEWQNKIGNLTGNEGKNSIVWYSPKLGALGVWTDGTDNWVSLSIQYVRYWELIGCGDFNGIGRDAVVMRFFGGSIETYYTIDINGKVQFLGTTTDWTGWEVRAIGDFSDDGRDDIVLFHKETGLMVMCADGNLDSYTNIGQLDAKDWFVVGAGDYNGDKKDDLLVRQYSTGMLGYYGAGDVANGWVELGRGVDMNWTVIA